MAYHVIKNNSAARSIDFAITMPPSGAKRGGTRVGINGGMGTEVLKQGATGFEVLYDPDAFKLALKLTNKVDISAFPLIFPSPQRTNRTTSISFMAWPLIQQIGWIAPTRVAIAMTYDSAGKTWEGILPREWVTNEPLKRKRQRKS